MGLTSVIRRISSSSENAVFLPVGLVLVIGCFTVAGILPLGFLVEKRFLAAEVEMKPTCNVLVVPHHKLVQERRCMFPTTLQLSLGIL